MKKLFKYGLGIPILSVFVITSFIGINYFDRVQKPADCAVIFGAAVWRDDVPSYPLYDRILGGIELYQQKKVNCLVLSGGPSIYGKHEVDVMKKLMREVHIPASKMILDYNGINTRATIKHLEKDKSYIFVSNDFHLARIKLFAWRYGLHKAQFYPVTYHYGRYIKEPYFIFREILGIAWYFKWEILFCWIGYFLLREKIIDLSQYVWYIFSRKIIKKIWDFFKRLRQK